MPGWDTRLTARQVADHAGVTIQAVYGWIKKGRVRSVRNKISPWDLVRAQRPEYRRTPMRTYASVPPAKPRKFPDFHLIDTEEL